MEGKERTIQILEHKISNIDNKLIAFDTFGISEKKKQRLEILKLVYEQQLEELLFE